VCFSGNNEKTGGNLPEQGGLENKQGGLPFYRQATLFVQMLRAGLGCRGGLKPGKGEFGFSAWDTFLYKYRGVSKNVGKTWR
jgi:hypothetical protein